MTLLIALMLNYTISELTGEQYVSTFIIVVVWVLHCLYHEAISK